MKTDKIGNLTFYNADNLEIMRCFKDNEFDLAIVDPPYGIVRRNCRNDFVAKFSVDNMVSILYRNYIDLMSYKFKFVIYK